MLKRIVQLTIALLVLITTMSVQAKSETPHHVQSMVKQERHTPKAKERVQGPTRTLKDFIDRHCTKKCVDPRRLDDVVAKASIRHRVPEKLILSVIRVESAFKQEAISGTQKGNMQIVVPLHRKRFHGRNPMILAVNIDVGTEILSECLVRKHGNINKTARCYNGGGDPAYEVKIRQALIELKTVEL